MHANSGSVLVPSPADRAYRPEPAEARRPDHRRDGGPDLCRHCRDLHLRPAGHAGAGRLRAGLSVHDADDHDGRRRHGRRRGGRHGPRDGRRPGRGRPCAGAARAGAGRRAGAALHPARLDGGGESLDIALTYSHVLFTGSLVIWANFFLSALLRGGGDAATPGRYMLLGSIAQVPLSYVLALGIGDWPGLGMAGPAVSSLATSAVSALLQARALWKGKLGFVPALLGIRLQGRLFWDILRVGLIASFSAFTANLTAMRVTGLVGRFGVAALAGYGIGVRLEFMLVPLAFGIGSGLTTLVGVAAGAHDWKRAVRVAWIGGLIAGGSIGAFGWIVALVPEGWARLFTSDPQVVAATVGYITHVAPFYCLFGLGMTLSFASQGAGRMTAPFFAGIV